MCKKQFITHFSMVRKLARVPGVTTVSPASLSDWNWEMCRMCATIIYHGWTTVHTYTRERRLLRVRGIDVLLGNSRLSHLTNPSSGAHNTSHAHAYLMGGVSFLFCCSARGHQNNWHMQAQYITSLFVSVDPNECNARVSILRNVQPLLTISPRSLRNVQPFFQLNQM